MRPSRSLLTAAVAGALVLAVGCSGPNPVTDAVAGGEASVAAAPAELVPVTLGVPPGLGQEPLDEPRTALVPPGWTLSVFARVPEARLATWAPDRTLLVSVPDEGRVVRLTPDGRGGAAVSTLLEGLNQPHGMAFAGSTLYLAQSDRVDAYAYDGGRATAPRPVVTGLPDKKSPDLRGAYAHALKSVALGPDGAVYVSVGSTGNISEAGPDVDAAARVDPAGPAGWRCRPSRSRPGSGTAPGSRSRRTARCGAG